MASLLYEIIVKKTNANSVYRMSITNDHRRRIIPAPANTRVNQCYDTRLKLVYAELEF